MLTRLTTIATVRGLISQVNIEIGKVMKNIPLSCFTPPDLVSYHGLTAGDNYAIKVAGIMFHRRSTMWVVDTRAFTGKHRDLINAGIAAQIGFLDGVGNDPHLLGIETLEALQYTFLVSMITNPNMSSLGVEVIDSLKLEMK